MPKTVFTQAQQLDLTKRLQVLLLDAMVASGSWVDATFQGGTSLCLVHGSPRFSEDLDFILGTDKGLNRMLSATATRLTNTLRVALPGAQVKFSARDDDFEVEAAKNPRTYTMTVSHPDWYRAIKVKVEFWVADPDAVKQYEAGLVTAKLLTALESGVPLRMVLAPVFVNTATLEEILVDKVHALACRAYMKHRDIFDLWWLAQQGVTEWQEQVVKRYPNHAQMYADSPPLEQLGPVLSQKAAAIAKMVGTSELSDELKKWLGDDSNLASMASSDAIAAQVVAHLQKLVVDLKFTAELNTPAAPKNRKCKP